MQIKMDRSMLRCKKGATYHVRHEIWNLNYVQPRNMIDERHDKMVLHSFVLNLGCHHRIMFMMSSIYSR